ncbi:hypothetical protein J4E82_011683 [Alternaria postmessia]|uniref:uncharacterized protein n=1 Tax=Alternaria postmessia TaxID=1187938 RepID=UPI0022244F59|nr:uncharacterized protein J4E82_011683 [Alternaria postmessia]KAI5362608.1 hypothetical protein J4E82_011683 [Alternaria postmessia]
MRVIVLPRQEMAHMPSIEIGRVLLDKSVRIRKGYDDRENPTHTSMLTVWLYSGYFWELGRENTAWTYLREATTQAQLLSMHDEETYKHEVLDAAQKRVLYWLLFISERTYALHKNRPISLHPTIRSPLPDEVSSDRPIAVGLQVMINMFSIVDDTFVNLWNRVGDSRASDVWVTQVQAQLSEAVPEFIECTKVQEVQIRMTQQWLRSLVWRLSTRQGPIGNASCNDPLLLEHSMEIARDLLLISNQFPQEMMVVHGTGLLSVGIIKSQSWD